MVSLVGVARCRSARLLRAHGSARSRRLLASAPALPALPALTALLIGLSLASSAGCSESVDERFTVQEEGDRFFVREKRGWFSTMFPCRPRFSGVAVGTDKVRMVLATCQLGEEVFSITFGRFKLPPGTVSPTTDQIYELAGRGMDGWAYRNETSRIQMDVVPLAGRSGRYFSFKNVPGGADAHVWVLWAEEQQAIYQLMLIGKRGPGEGQRMVRAMLVPSP